MDLAPIRTACDYSLVACSRLLREFTRPPLAAGAHEAPEVIYHTFDIRVELKQRIPEQSSSRFEAQVSRRGRVLFIPCCE